MWRSCSMIQYLERNLHDIKIHVLDWVKGVEILPVKA